MTMLDDRDQLLMASLRDGAALRAEIERLRAILRNVALAIGVDDQEFKAFIGIEQHAKIDAAVDDMVEKYPKTLDHLRRS